MVCAANAKRRGAFPAGGYHRDHQISGAPGCLIILRLASIHPPSRLTLDPETPLHVVHVGTTRALSINYMYAVKQPSLSLFCAAAGQGSKEAEELVGRSFGVRQRQPAMFGLLCDELTQAVAAGRLSVPLKEWLRASATDQLEGFLDDFIESPPDVQVCMHLTMSVQVSVCVCGSVSVSVCLCVCRSVCVCLSLALPLSIYCAWCPQLM